ncbi:MAG: Insecticidal toxin complex protein [Gelidibacter sp.]
MKVLMFLGLLLLSSNGMAKEWNCLKAYQKETNRTTLRPQDWLKRDRLRNTLTWQNANAYNLTNNKPGEYQTIKQRKDFFEWLDSELKAKGHEVVWPSMASFISNKLRLLECFPYRMLTNRKMKEYAKAGSDAVFINSFGALNNLYQSEPILKGENAVQWDKDILHEEQYEWVEEVYQTMDARSIEHIERIAKGKSFYSMFVPKEIRFEGDISKAEDRYDYALHKLREYCLSLNK